MCACKKNCQGDLLRGIDNQTFRKKEIYKRTFGNIQNGSKLQTFFQTLFSVKFFFSNLESKIVIKTVNYYRPRQQRKLHPTS